MADWQQIESVLDDRTEAHMCAFCGGGIPRGDEACWGVAARDMRDNVSVMWVHVPCFLAAVRPHLRTSFVAMSGAAPFADRLVRRSIETTTYPSDMPGPGSDGTMQQR